MHFLKKCDSSIKQVEASERNKDNLDKNMYLS